MHINTLKPASPLSAGPRPFDRDTAELIDAVLRGDTAATRAFVIRLLPVIRARVRRGLGASQSLGSLQAHDIVQEMWIVLFKNECAQIRHWDPARGATLEGYIGMVVDREIGNLRARTGAKKRSGRLIALESSEPLTDTTPNPECLLLERASAQTLWAHLTHSLPARGRDVLIHLCFECGTLEQTADTLGVDRQVIYNWRHEIRKKTRHFLSTQRPAAFSQKNQKGNPVLVVNRERPRGHSTMIQEILQ